MLTLGLLLFACGKKKARDGRTDTPTSGTIKFASDDCCRRISSVIHRPICCPFIRTTTRV